ncbi:MAG: hypothetical protein EOP06_04905 [Proteobacteria bacterium]|nr:MAG: hypothetical protein EOP06_04905 [Pseudomonadota bacterium]
MNRLASFLTLFTSMTTLLCCALPTLLVGLGLGAVMAGLATNLPGLIWISENKALTFSISGLVLLGNGIWLWLNRNAACPTDPRLRDACLSGRRSNRILYTASVLIFLVGSFFAYLAPILFA